MQRDKIYPSPQALAELEKMNSNALNSKQNSTDSDLKLVSINIRSLRKHMVDLISKPHIMQSEVILVQQTCLKKDECINA